MKKITLQEAFRLLEQKAEVLRVDNGIILCPLLDGLTGEDEHEFMYLGWADGGNEYCLKFREENNREVEIHGDAMFLYDTDDDIVKIELLAPVQIEEYLVKKEGKSVKMSDEYKKWLKEDEIKPGQVWTSCDGAGIEVVVISSKNDMVEYAWIENDKAKKHSKSVFSFQVRYYLKQSMQKQPENKHAFAGQLIVDEDGNEYTIKIDGTGVDWYSPETMSAIANDDNLLKKYIAVKQAQSKV
jgi:hypothetical protein